VFAFEKYAGMVKTKYILKHEDITLNPTKDMQQK
jgi:hypothetical protein